MPQTRPTQPLPPRPRAVLRLGFAGRRELSSAAEQTLQSALGRVFGIIGARLAELPPTAPTANPAHARVADFFDHQRPPLLRLITGLCEGADSIAAEALGRLVADARPSPRLATELAAVLPFDPVTYRDSRRSGFRAEFDRQAQACSYILALDGRYAKPRPDTPVARRRRTKAYRAQSRLLLRHADILVAATDPEQPGKAGGTLETARAALAFDLPVLFVHPDSGGTWLIAPQDDLDAVLAGPPLALDALDAAPDAAPDAASPAAAPLEAALRGLVSRVMADPDLAIDQAGGDGTNNAERQLLHEYFDAAELPPTRPDREARPQRRPSWRERCWTWLATRLSAAKGPRRDPPLPAYAPYRDRATSLNYHYTGLYRGAFVLSYGLAVVAVALAALSLALIAVTPGGDHGAAPGWLLWWLLGLGGLKLAILGFIVANTHQANHGHWNDLAVDYRYLAERLRALYYLPRAGSFQPPAAEAPRYALRLVRQSLVDWLFNAIARSVSPATLAQETTIPAHDGNGEVTLRVLRPDARDTLTRVRDDWIRGQVAYHARNADAMARLERGARRLGGVLGWSVIGVVAVDLAIITLDLLHLLPPAIAHGLHGLTPWLLFLAAVLPAAVASLNGLRFQSECGRLAERSTLIGIILDGRVGDSALSPHLVGGRRQQVDALLERIVSAPSGADGQADLAAWSVDVLMLSERIASDCVREVAEWTTLYDKPLPET